jgi:hypothetical protein
MTYNLVKSAVPPLVDQQLMMKIAKINNIDFKTGNKLPELIKPPTEFQLLCEDIKNNIIQFIRKNLLSISLLIIITIGLTYRYYQVKEIKRKQKELEHKVKKTIHVPEISTKNDVNINESVFNDTNHIIDMYKHYDDNNSRNSIINDNIVNKNMYHTYAAF